jgi:NTP pyrophosphatase (non-canonical NTP hydrolase)
MTLNEYQEQAKKTAQYPILGHAIVYPALGLNGEAGEVAEKVKKLMRDHNGVLNYDRKMALLKEIGDCLWYVSECARQAGFDLETVAAFNIHKLEERLKAGTIKGEGDNR